MMIKKLSNIEQGSLQKHVLSSWLYHDNAEAHFVEAAMCPTSRPTWLMRTTGMTITYTLALCRLSASHTPLRTRRISPTSCHMAKMHSTTKLIPSSLACVNPSKCPRRYPGSGALAWILQTKCYNVQPNLTCKTYLCHQIGRSK